SLINVRTCDAWGNFTDTQPANADRYGFATMQSDSFQGDNFDNARRYRPTTSTFESPDPIGVMAGGDTNDRRYLRNNPTSVTDPSGLKEIPIIYPFSTGHKDVVLNVSVDIDNGKTLTIKVQKGPDYTGQSKGFPFFEAMGAEVDPKGPKDTDSAQVALL